MDVERHLVERAVDVERHLVERAVKTATIRVQGNASAEELAALLAALYAQLEPGAVAESGYRRWRTIRLAAVHPRLAADPRGLDRY